MDSSRALQQGQHGSILNSLHEVFVSRDCTDTLYMRSSQKHGGGFFLNKFKNHHFSLVEVSVSSARACSYVTEHTVIPCCMKLFYLFTTDNALI
ncbi:putative brefeldin A-inhibited guanine nucleotide-exchange [Sesbania bispinosa]|nr:putative brefeldin A-inhibited guanine nucleotide-exchange [Sesbania bispinosa]